MVPRVFVTGVGVVSSIGLGRAAFFRALEQGVSGISPVASFDASPLGRQVAGEVKEFEPRDHTTHGEQQRMGRCAAMALAAARMAVADAEIKAQALAGPRTAVVIGTTMGEARILAEMEYEWIVHGPQAVTRALIMGAYSDGTKNKKCILVLDDTVIKSKMLGLDQEMTMVATMAGAMGISGWFFVQKPTDAGKTALWSFSQSDHIFIARDPDKRNRERYTEIGGFDSKEVERVSQTLQTYQFLYLERKHRYMCIVDKD